ncbi:hypothetical protein MRX96_057868 [Rhipicephalus microplus]
MEPSEVKSERDLFVVVRPFSCLDGQTTKELQQEQERPHPEKLLMRHDFFTDTRTGATESRNAAWRTRASLSLTCLVLVKGLCSRLRKEGKAFHLSGGKLTTPSRKHLRNAEGRRRCTKFDSFTLCALRSCLHDFFRRNEIPMVEKTTAEFSVRTQLPSLRRCTVRRLLTDIGFKHGERSCNSLLLDQDDIIDRRNHYLRDVESYQAEDQKIVYLDET